LPSFHDIDDIHTRRSRPKVDKAVQETTEESEFRKQQAMQAELKQMVNRNQVVMERSRRTAYSGNVRSSKPLTVSQSVGQPAPALEGKCVHSRPVFIHLHCFFRSGLSSEAATEADECPRRLPLRAPARLPACLFRSRKARL